jgi:hypothetical protein
MKKTPLWGNALLILNVHQEHETLNNNLSIIRKEASDDACK